MHCCEVAAARHDAEEPDYAVDIGFRPIPADPPMQFVQRRVGLRHLPMRKRVRFLTARPRRAWRTVMTKSSSSATDAPFGGCHSHRGEMKLDAAAPVIALDGEFEPLAGGCFLQLLHQLDQRGCAVDAEAGTPHRQDIEIAINAATVPARLDEQFDRGHAAFGGAFHDLEGETDA